MKNDLQDSAVVAYCHSWLMGIRTGGFCGVHPGNGPRNENKGMSYNIAQLALGLKPGLISSQATGKGHFTARIICQAPQSPRPRQSTAQRWSKSWREDPQIPSRGTHFMIHCGREACLLGNDEEDNDPWVPCDNEASDTCLATPPIQVVCRNNATANTPISWDWLEGRKITFKYQSNPKKMPKIMWLPSNPPPKHVYTYIYI